MAATLPPISAFDIAKRNIKNMPLEQIQVRVLDDINKLMWMAAPWRWTIGTLTPITLTSTTSSYTLAPPSDFLYLIAAYIADGAGPVRHLAIMPTIPASIVVTGMPQFISYEGSNTFRVSPVPGTQVTPIKQIIAYYKKKAPVVSAQTCQTAGFLTMDDEWFHVYEAGVLWYSYLYGDDQRAGTCNATNDGKIAYTGQRAVFEAGLDMMRQREPLPIFDARVTRDQKETA